MEMEGGEMKEKTRVRVDELGSEMEMERVNE